MARLRGIKARHPLGSVATRSGVSQLSVVAAASSATASGHGVKISELPAADAANDTDQLEVNQNGTSRRITIAQLAVGAGGGTVTSTSVVSANGLAGTVATPTTTPAITLSTTVTGLVKGNGTVLSAAVAGTDYMPAAMPDGTAAAPGLAFASDPDTGIYRVQADLLGVAGKGIFNVYPGFAGSLFLGTTGIPALTTNTTGANPEIVSTPGQHNIGIGQGALAAVTNTAVNIAIGFEALKSAQSRECLSIAIGYQALMTSESDGENIAIGYHAMRSNTTGIHNTAVGVVAMTDKVTGDFNTIYGSHAAFEITGGASNTVLGYRAMGTTGAVSISDNTAVGTVALRQSTGSNNTAVGSAAASAVGTFTRMVALGRQAAELATGNDITAIGHQAARSSTGAQVTAVGSGAAFNNTAAGLLAVGYNAATANTSGGNNTALGSFALLTNTTGSSNTAVGYQALQGITLASTGAIAMGYQAGYSSTGAANYNTMIGYASGYGITSGVNNTLIGAAVLSASYAQVTTGSNNISIGKDVAVPTATASNQLCIGNFIYGTGLSGSGATMSPGKIGLGVKAPATELDVVGTIAASATLRLPHGSAPASPVNGDIWTTTAGLFVRINGATVGPLT